MTDTPTATPALTGEQIDAPSVNEVRADYVRDHTRNFDSYTVGRSLTSEQEVYGTRFDNMLDAVIARAKREERERIGDEIAAWLDKEGSPPIWYQAVDIADPTYCERHPEEADHD